MATVDEKAETGGINRNKRLTESWRKKDVTVFGTSVKRCELWETGCENTTADIGIKIYKTTVLIKGFHLSE